ncbi:MAG: Uncharacterized protein involved in methicillin resistance [Parcubacteria group bacterium Licking1014_1]|nr:MAG: Uncharacterized protein involved in methicillin resistance [Parcubacteria group bacterium Licking1014_1]
MNLDFIGEEKRKIWNDFLIKNKGSFLQSFEWGIFQKKLSKQVWQAEIKKENKTMMEAQVIKEIVGFKRYFYVPYGPVFSADNSSEENAEAFRFFLDKIKELAKREKIVFLRIEPVLSLPEFPEFNFQNSLKRIQPKRTLILNLEDSEENLLKNFHQKTRYNIKLAEKKGVKIKISDNYSNIFYKLLKETKERQEFRSYPEEYYKKLLQIDSPYFQVNLFTAEYQNKIIVASIVIFFGERVVSLHTGSDYRYRTAKGAHFLRWKTVLEAKKKKFKEYDMWGIDEKKWPGVTYLKKSFGGKEFEYGPAKDIVFQNGWYRVYKIIKKLL